MFAIPSYLRLVHLVKKYLNSMVRRGISRADMMDESWFVSEEIDGYTFLL